MILDLYAGPGGWDEAAASLGHRDTVGLEWDHSACLTASQAGHARIRADVAGYPTGPFVGRVRAVLGSPPCQAWSMAGKRKGELDRANCHRLADRMAGGDDTTDWTSWEDERSALVCQPVRWVRDLRPPVVALEQVPPVEGLWEHFARIFRSWGYTVWVKVLCAADYGVPQTRRRVILGASLDGAQPPEPTHSEVDAGADLFGSARLPWATMADALGWGFDDEPAATITSGGGASGGPEPFANARYRARLKRYVRMGNQAGATVRGIDEPTPTLLFGHRSNAVTWHDARPPSRAEQDEGLSAEGGVRVTVEEAGILQGFRPGYPWQGSRSKKFEQVGNALPPPLAAAVLASLLTNPGKRM